MFDEKSYSLKMDKAIEVFSKELSSLRTGRANASMLDLIKVDVYGQLMPINQIGSITTPEPRMINIQVWDASNVSLIDAAIKLFKTLLESPIHVILSFDIDFFLISSTVKTSDKICVACELGLNPLIIGIDKYFLNSVSFSSLSVLNMKALPKFDNILAVSSILSAPLDKCNSSGLNVKVLPPSCLIAK